MILDDSVLNRKEVIRKLQESGLLKLQYNEESILNNLKEANTPWFIRVFIGISAWMSAGLFLIFLFSVKAITEKGSLAFGILFLIVAVLLSGLHKKNDFFSQLSLAFNFCGHTCTIIGLVSAYHLKVWEYLTVFFILELALFILFRDGFQKFLSAVSIPFLIAFLLKEFQIEIFIHFLILVQAIYIVFSFEKENLILSRKILHDFEKPFQYAMILSFLGLISFIFVTINNFLPAPYWYITGIGLTICMSYFGWTRISSREDSYPNAMEIGAGIFFALLVGVTSLYAPGIPAAILILLIAFSKKDVMLFGLGILFLFAFLFGYYYNLNLSLLIKSIVLMGSGILLVLFRFLLIKTNLLEDKRI